MDEDEIYGLQLTHISTRGELDFWEQKNIANALGWLSRISTTDIISEPFIRKVHKKMFDDVWVWAGKYRKSDKNIGIAWYNIIDEVKKLCDDANFWVNNGTYEADMMAVVFHHRMVSIHPFPNGNGRHSRIMADIIIEKIYNRTRFTWGKNDLNKESITRDNYLKSLYAADKGDYDKLLKFARS